MEKSIKMRVRLTPDERAYIMSKTDNVTQFFGNIIDTLPSIAGSVSKKNRTFAVQFLITEEQSIKVKNFANHNGMAVSEVLRRESLK